MKLTSVCYSGMGASLNCAVEKVRHYLVCDEQT